MIDHRGWTPDTTALPGPKGTLVLDIAYPERLSRLLIFVIPHLFILAFVGLAAGVVTFIAFFATLITGSYPRSMFDFMVGFMRWTLRVNLYLLSLTDVYPPFSFE
jgi:hypothetical protein